MIRAIPRDADSSIPSATFLFCVESGYFEGQILAAVDAIRRFAGRLKNAPILVVTPRAGPSLTKATLKGLADSDVRYVYRDKRNPCDWYPYMNKALAAELAEELAATDQIIWLDSDCLVVSEPTELVLGAEEDFACCAVDKNVGSSGPADPNEAYWSALSQHFGIPLDRLPWVTTAYDKVRVRMRLHSGVYSFRRSRMLGRAFVHDIASMLESRVLFSEKLPYPGDDVALAYSVVRLNLRWRLLPMSYNLEMTPGSRIYDRSLLPDARILHFHQALGDGSGHLWFLGELERSRADVAEWLRSRVPLATNTGGAYRSLVRRLLKERRLLTQNKHRKSSRITVHE